MSYETYTVTVKSVDGSNRYFINGEQQPTLYLEEGRIYEFDQSHLSNLGHPLMFSLNVDGTHAGSGAGYTTDVTTTGTAGSSGAKVVVRVLANLGMLYYYCGNHSGMGGQIITPSSTINQAPVFVNHYRSTMTEVKQNSVNNAIKVLTPGPNGERIHQISLTSDDPSNEITLDFGYYESIATQEAVNLVPGSTPASDPFTLTKTNTTNWDADSSIQGLETNLLVALSDSVSAANRGEYRVQSITALVLTLANTPGNTITQQLGVNVDIWRWMPLFSIPVAAQSGLATNPTVSGLSTTYAPQLDSDRYMILNRPLYVRNAANTSGNQGSVYVNIYSGAY